MKQKDVKLGEVYAVRIGDRLAPVRIKSASNSGGWNGLNLWSRREIRIKSAQRLRWACCPHTTNTKCVAYSCQLIKKLKVGEAR